MAEQSAIRDEIKKFILDEFLPGEDPNELTPETPLVSSGILDSIATLKLVTFLEETYDIAVEPHEVDAENLDTLDLIKDLINSKL
ncbi:MAG: acyl carrier protein [bacterium]|nr:acyl carrier protein [Deltaproteobacteria bacterium]MCP4904786.1 acyl carrier protein [bacterium]